MKESLQVVLKKAGMAYEIDFSDVIALKANTVLAFNKNYKFNENYNNLEIKDNDVENIRSQFVRTKEFDNTLNKKKTKPN